MAISRGELKGRVLRFLNKTANVRGFYSDDKLDEAIQEAMDYVAVEMFVAGEGWLTKMHYFDTSANFSALTLPANIALIREVRYKVGDVFYVVNYDDQENQPSTIGSDENQRAWRYRLLGRDIVFDPQLAEGGPRNLQIEAVHYPGLIASDSDMIEPQFDAAMLHFMKYKVASILAGSLEKEVRTWGAEENEWYTKMQTVVTRRTLKTRPIRDAWP